MKSVSYSPQKCVTINPNFVLTKSSGSFKITEQLIVFWLNIIETILVCNWKILSNDKFNGIIHLFFHIFMGWCFLFLVVLITAKTFVYRVLLFLWISCFHFFIVLLLQSLLLFFYNHIWIRWWRLFSYNIFVLIKHCRCFNSCIVFRFCTSPLFKIVNDTPHLHTFRSWK